MKMPPTRTQWVLIVALTLATVPYFIRLGASSLWDSNEAFYAETPREMIESRDYINPAFNYRLRPNKPPLSYWVVILSYKLFGTSEAAERLPIALAAMIMIATAYGLGRAAFSVEAGLLAAIGLAIAPRFLMFSRRIVIDVYLAMFMALALMMFVLAERLPKRRRLFLILMYVAAGLGVITKGPVAAALPAIAIAIYLALYRRPGRLREMMLPAGLLIVAAIVLPWYVAIYSQRGWSEIETFIMKDNLSRFAQPVWGPRRGVLFYVPMIISDLFPWSFFLLPIVWLGARRLWSFKRDRLVSDEGPRAKTSVVALLAIWIAVIVLFFSISRSKEDLYILPIYPAAAALVGGLLAGLFNKQRSETIAVRWTALMLAALFAAAGAFLLYSLSNDAGLYPLAGATVIGCAGVIGGLAGSGAALLTRTRAALLITGLTMTACNWVFVLWTLPDFERYKPVRPLCETIAAEAGPDALVGYYRVAYPSMVFYLRRPILEYYEESEIKDALSSAGEVYCVMTNSEYESIRTQLPGRTRVLARHPISQVKLRGIVDRVDPPQVVLISNTRGANIAR